MFNSWNEWHLAEKSKPTKKKLESEFDALVKIPVTFRITVYGTVRWTDGMHCFLEWDEDKNSKVFNDIEKETYDFYDKKKLLR